MRRRQKRLLQAAGLVLAALLLLPSVYRGQRGGAEIAAPREVAAPVEAPVEEVQVRHRKDAFSDGNIPQKKDWHDHKTIRRDLERTGNGEQGNPYPLTDADRVEHAYKENGFNIYVSDNISLNRSLPDIRHANCKNKLYLAKLPNTSVIIPFHNEGWSSLLRTVHSILNRSPPELIAEIVLVDDFSDKGASDSKSS